MKKVRPQEYGRRERNHRKAARKIEMLREMTLDFYDFEVPVASSMLKVADGFVEAHTHPLHVFTWYWTAFNNIYVTVADRKGKKAELQWDGDGNLKTRALGAVTVPKVKTVSEQEQLQLAFEEFSDDLKTFLVAHENTLYFAQRTPSWWGNAVAVDANGQPVNGVINVGYTVDLRYPVWSPIDTKALLDFRADLSKVELRDSLARQVLELLYTVRNNTFHGGKQADDANDQEVLQRAVPLLAAIVRAFVRDRVRTP